MVLGKGKLSWLTEVEGCGRWFVFVGENCLKC